MSEHPNRGTIFLEEAEVPYMLTGEHVMVTAKAEGVFQT